MEGGGQRAIREHFSRLVQNINPNPILDRLFDKGWIASRKFKDIIENERSDRARLLLLHVRKTIRFEAFLGLLEDTGVEGQMIRDLRSSALSNEGETESSDEESDSEDNRIPRRTIKQKMGGIVMRGDGNTVHVTLINTRADQETSAVVEGRARVDDKRIAKSEIFDIIENTMLHDPLCHGSIKYPRVTYGLFTINGEEVSGIFERDEFMHWEEKAILDLMRRIRHRQGQQLCVDLYSNWSPCPACVEAVLRFLRWGVDEGLELQVTVRVAALYRMTWPACEEMECSHLSFSRNYHRKEYRQAVVKLARYGVSVKAFNEESWKVIKGALGIQGDKRPYSEDRQTTDVMVELSLLDMMKSE